MLEMEQKQGGVTGRSQHLDGGIVGRKVVKDLGFVAALCDVTKGLFPRTAYFRSQFMKSVESKQSPRWDFCRTWDL